MSFAWNTEWYHAEESTWSVANKLAYASCASVAEVLGALAGVTRNRREAWLFPTTEQASLACKHLNLSLGFADGQLFAAIAGIPSLTERQHWQLGIRFCRACLLGFVHRTYFQDRRFDRCKLHDDPLQSVCPFCRSSIDPLCPQAWVCNECGKLLARPSSVSWPAQYRNGPDCLEKLMVEEAGKSSPQTSWGEFVDQRLVSHWAYETHSSICSVVLGAHMECAQHEYEASACSGGPIYFSCPLAASAIVVANQLGFSAQCLDGAWVAPRPRRAAAFVHLQFLLAKYPVTAHQGIVERLVLSWFSEALDCFVAARRHPQEWAYWQPSPDPHIRAKSSVDSQQLTARARTAGSLCGGTENRLSKR